MYFVRRSDDVKAEVAGSVYMTRFNHVVNTPRARLMLGIIARRDKMLPVCLAFGPVNGPEDFA